MKTLDDKLNPLPADRREAIEAAADALRTELRVSAVRHVRLAKTPHRDKNA